MALFVGHPANRLRRPDREQQLPSHDADGIRARGRVPAEYVDGDTTVTVLAEPAPAAHVRAYPGDTVAIRSADGVAQFQGGGPAADNFG